MLDEGTSSLGGGPNNFYLGDFMAMPLQLVTQPSEPHSPEQKVLNLDLGLDLARLLEQSGSLVFAVQDTRLVYVNGAVQSLLGYLPAELIGRPVTDLIASEQQAMIAERAVSRQAGQQVPGRYELALLHADGRRRWFDLQVSLHRQGGNAYSVGLGHDISERKQAEAKLQSTNRELEDFAAMVAHDLRHPLHAIDGFSAALQDLLPAEQSEGLAYVKRVRQESRRMSDMIDRLLEMTQVQHAELKRREVDLSRLFRSVVRDQLARHPGAPLEMIVEPALRTEGDADLLRLVLCNLVDNALKFSTGNERLLELGSFVGEAGVVFFVRDKGLGFSHHQAKEIFHPLRRLDNSKDISGHGIGLATVQRVIQRHGGKIWAESRPGEGATFFFTLCRAAKFSQAPKEAWV